MSDLKKLEQIWKLVTIYGTVTRLGDLDGLKKWNELKANLEKCSSGAFSTRWLDVAVARYYHMKKSEPEGGLGLLETVDECGDIKQIWDYNHFFLQHARIPKNNRDKFPEGLNDVTFVTLMQIAYNAGQLNAEMNVKKNPFYLAEHPNWITYYSAEKLSSFTSYITSTECTRLNDIITLDDVQLIKETLLMLTYNLLPEESKPSLDGGYQYKSAKYIEKIKEVL